MIAPRTKNWVGTKHSVEGRKGKSSVSGQKGIALTPVQPSVEVPDARKSANSWLRRQRLNFFKNSQKWGGMVGEIAPM